MKKHKCKKLNLTQRGEAWGVFYHFQLLGLKEKINPQLVSKLYIFSRGYMLRGTWRLGCLHSSRKLVQSGKSGRQAGWQTAHQGSSCLSAASHLPLNIWIPRGVTRRHMLACPCCSEKLLTWKERTRRYGSMWNQRPAARGQPLPSALWRVEAGRAEVLLYLHRGCCF